VDDTEGAALTLEYLAFGRSRVEGSHSLPHFGGRLPSTVSKHAPNNDYHLTRTGVAISPTTADLVTGGSMEVIRRPSGAGADGRPSIMPPDERDARVDALLDLIGPTDVFDLFYKRTDVALRALTKVLPSRERGELLVRAVGRMPVRL